MRRELADVQRQIRDLRSLQSSGRWWVAGTLDATYDSIRGPVGVHWGLDGKTIHLTATMPVHVSATVYMPTGDVKSVTESDAPVDKTKGVAFARSAPGFAVYEIGSGSYAFAAARP